MLPLSTQLNAGLSVAPILSAAFIVSLDKLPESSFCSGLSTPLRMREQRNTAGPLAAQSNEAVQRETEGTIRVSFYYK